MLDMFFGGGGASRVNLTRSPNNRPNYHHKLKRQTQNRKVSQWLQERRIQRNSFGQGMDGCRDGCRDGWKDGWTDGWMDKEYREGHLVTEERGDAGVRRWRVHVCVDLSLGAGCDA